MFLGGGTNGQGGGIFGQFLGGGSGAQGGGLPIVGQLPFVGQLFGGSSNGQGGNIPFVSQFMGPNSPFAAFTSPFASFVPGMGPQQQSGMTGTPNGMFGPLNGMFGPLNGMMQGQGLNGMPNPNTFLNPSQQPVFNQQPGPLAPFTNAMGQMGQLPQQFLPGTGTGTGTNSLTQMPAALTGQLSQVPQQFLNGGQAQPQVNPAQPLLNQVAPPSP